MDAIREGMRELRHDGRFARLTLAALALWAAARQAGAEDRERSSGQARIAPLRLYDRAEILRELERAGRFRAARPFYAGHMGQVYDDALSVVSRDRHDVELREGETYLDPTTEAHESLHGMSSLIRDVRGESIAEGYDIIYVGDGRFAEIRVNPDATKADVRDWLPRRFRSSVIVKTHLDDPRFGNGSVALIAEELAYHVLDGRIGLENHRYMGDKLGITNAVTAPAADWAVLTLAAATMLDADPDGFPSRAHRQQFNALVKRLVEQAARCYARGMDVHRYGMLANVAPELRNRFGRPLAEESRQAGAIRGFCERTFGVAWLDDLMASVERARDATEVAAGIYNP